MFTKADIEKYFNAEKSQTLLFLCLGIVSIIVAITFFFFIKTDFYKGAAIPLLLVGLLMATAGYTVYKRSDADRVQNVYAYDLNPSELKNKELPRMQKVMANFKIYKWVEIILAIAGLALFFYFKSDIDKTFWKGFGLALTIIAVITFTADFFAAKRGATYTDGLQSFINQTFK